MRTFYFPLYIGNLQLKMKHFLFPFEKHARAPASAVICWLLPYWFNCLLSSQLHCLTDRWRATHCTHSMHENPTCQKTTTPFSHYTSLISLCLMSGTTLGWQVQNSFPLHFLQSLLNYFVYWPANGCDGSVQIYVKKSSLLADDCQLSHLLQLDPRGQLEPLGHYKDLKVVTLNWNRDSKKWKCAKRKTANVAQKTEGKCWAFRNRSNTAPFSS